MIQLRQPEFRADDGTYIYNLFRELAAAWEPRNTESLDNYAYLYSNQWSSYNTSMKRFDNYLTAATDDRVRMTLNKMRPIMEARTGFIVGENPKIYVNSESTETKHRQQGAIAQRVARADWEQHKIRFRCLDTWEWTKSFGVGYTQTYYDPYAGRYLGRDERGGNVFEGQVKQKVLSSGSVFYDPYASAWEDVFYVIVGSVVPREVAIENEWNIDWQNMTNDKFLIAATTYEEMRMSLNQPYLKQAREVLDQDGKPRNILVTEYYERPSRKHPFGRYIVTVGKNVVRSDVLEVGEIPIVPFVDSPEAGTIVGATPATDMRPYQEQLNRMASLDLERSNMPDIYAFPQGWQAPRRMSSKSVIIGNYNARMTGEPKFIAGGIQREDYLIKMRYYEEQMENAAGVSSLTTRGKTSSGMSGRLGYIVTEEGKKVLGRISERFGRSVEDVVRMRLKFINKYYTEQRQASYVNEEDRREIVRYRGADIGNNWAITIRLHNTLENPDLIAQRALQLATIPFVQQEIMTNRVFRKKLYEIIAPELGHDIMEGETDYDVARDENFEFSQGGNPQVDVIHDDDKHMEEHKRQLDSDTIRGWHPYNIERLKIHYFNHEAQKDAKFRKQMMKQMMMAYAMAGGQRGSQPAAKGTAPVARSPQPSGGGEGGDGVQARDRLLELQTKLQYPNAPGG